MILFMPLKLLLNDATFSNTGLTIPYNRMLPNTWWVEFEGEMLPGKYDWKWDVASKNEDGAWIGDVKCGHAILIA
jgi:hypothetical protein